MGFNYAREKYYFDRMWNGLEQKYRDAGMSEQVIRQLYAYDWQWFCSCRTYADHTQPLPKEFIMEGLEEHSNLIRKFETLQSTQSAEKLPGRLDWIEEIENRALYRKIKRLSKKDLELLTLLVIDGYNQPQMANLLGCSQSNIAQKIARIKKYLGNF